MINQTLTILASRFKEVADLVAENERLKDALAAYQTAAPQKAPSLSVEPETTPLPTEPEAPEANDEASAAEWGEPAPAPKPANSRRSRR